MCQQIFDLGVPTAVSLACFPASDVMSFDGSSSALVYRPNPGSRETSRDVLTLKFKTLTNSGMVLQVEEQEGHVLSLELDKGKLLLLFRKGTIIIMFMKRLRHCETA